ncbi:MAG TPA: hypothetical protein VIJ35_26775 [Bradyrhizobium sp.]
MVSFKNELARYDAKLERSRADESTWNWVKLGDGQRLLNGSAKQHEERINNRSLDDDQRHLTAWQEHDDVEKVWDKIKKNSPTIEAQEFIRTVLAVRLTAEDLVLRVDIHDHFSKDGMKQFTKQKNEVLLSKRPLAERIEAVKAQMDILQIIAKWPAPFISDDLKVSRQGSSSKRAQVVFVHLIDRFIRKISGRRMYGEITILTDVAFPGHKLDIEKIRDLLRRRSTRRKQAAKSARR